MSCLFSGREVDLPIQVTDEQRDIILCRNVSFVIGRSGTGTTTILTLKVLEDQKYFLHPSKGRISEGESSRTRNVEDFLVCRQLFVTVSPRLYTIPETFVKIPVKCFPLVITFQKFLIMMDLTLGNSFLKRFEERDGSHGNYASSVELQEFMNLKEVTYERFCSVYWDHFPSALTRKLDPSRVFTEIISHIKGGLQAGGCNDGKLSRERYCSLAGSRSSTLNEGKRDFVYTIFQAYEKRKSERGEFDLGDFVNDIHLRLKNEKYKGDLMDYVYIDEVQDLTMRQILLFKYICEDVDHGFIFAGDTAQTIARGIDFRFQDIRSLFYKEFVSTQTGKHMSEIKQLKQNFRTHAAVLDLAQSVIDVLYEYFSHSIDRLEPETSLITGEAPVLLESGSDENPLKTIFGDTGTSGKMAGFGADQVILVRDDEAKEEACNSVGEKALVLTILECKGLEFQDVLLYNFFGTSPLKEKWRVLYSYMKRKNLLDGNLTRSVQTFSEEKHNVLCSELKQLYVAITRTRQRLWICESIEYLSTPMFDYWKKRGLVQVRKLDDSLAQAIKVASSPQEWLARGKQLFFDNNYVMATTCFERAGDTTWEKLAKASSFKAAARGTTNVETFTRYLREAAKIFESIGKLEFAASCYYDSRDYEEAGNMYMHMCGKLDVAAQCFTLAGCYSKAAEAYAKGNEFSKCLLVCEEGQLFDEGLHYIESWKEGNNVQGEKLEETEQKFLETCARHYHVHEDPKSMMKFVRAFCSMESKRVFLRSLSCLDELLLLEEELGHFCEARELASSWGDILKEADLLEKAGDFEGATHNLCWHVLLSSLWGNGNRGWPLKPFVERKNICDKAILLAARESDEMYNDACRFIKVVLSDQHSSLPELKLEIRASQHGSVEQFFSIRKILEYHFIIRCSDYAWEDKVIEGISEKKVLVETLVFYWNHWKALTLNLLESIEEADKDNELFKFNLKFFGVRAEVLEGTMVYLIVNKDADWLRNCGGLHSDGKRVTCNGQELVWAMRSYWQLELFSVGIKVLQTLKGLQESKSKGPAHHQSKSILNLFDVSNFLLNDINLTGPCKKKVQSFRGICTSYFDIVFPLDWRNAISKELIALRKTNLSGDLLRWIMEEDIYIKGLTKLTIGKVIMLSLEEGIPEECLKIIDKHKCSLKLKCFFETIRSNVPAALVCALALEDNLEETMSPHSFLYSLDYLITIQLMSSGVFFTTRSSFVRYEI
ncbi:UvrD-like helicase, ATP-binding domain, P-loop containing nucleoside triphosphate hydrolase [Tanacetum coccineum]